MASYGASGVVVVGIFARAGDVASVNNVALWSGSAWAPLGLGVDQYAYCVLPWTGPGTSEPSVIVGGIFSMAGGAVAANGIAQWSSASGWRALGTGVDGYVVALAVFRGAVVAAGSFTRAGTSTAANVAQWDGSAWSALGSGTDGVVYAIAEFDGELIVGGAFAVAGGNNAAYVALWTGTTWKSLINGMSAPVYAVVAYNNFAVVGGTFTRAGGQSVNGIAQWDGYEWEALDTGVNGGVYALAVFQGALMVGGDFTAAGGISSPMLAQWTGRAWSAVGGAAAANATVGDAVTAFALYTPPTGPPTGDGNDDAGAGGSSQASPAVVAIVVVLSLLAVGGVAMAVMRWRARHARRGFSTVGAHDPSLHGGDDDDDDETSYTPLADLSINADRAPLQRTPGTP